MKLRFFLLKKIIVILIFSLLFISCSSTRVFNSYEDAKILENESVEIHLITGKVYETDNMFVAKDSTRILDKTSGSFISVPTRDIRYIIDIHHTLGAFEWMALGALLGFTYGAIWENTNTRSSHKMISPRVYHGSIGAIIGILPGTIIGHKFYYILPDDSRDSATTFPKILKK